MRFVDKSSTEANILLVLMLVTIGASMSATIPVYIAEVNCVLFKLKKSGAQGSNVSNFAQTYSLWSAAYDIRCTLGPLSGGWIQQLERTG